MKPNSSRTLTVLLTVLVGLAALTGCKTNENNYRRAYERAIADNDRNVTDFDKTVYSRYRNQVREVNVRVDSADVATKVIAVRVTDGGGGIREWLKKYSVVVGEFKQLFNANSLRTRFAEAGYPRAFLVENPEPYYYVVVASSDNIRDMMQIADSIRANSPIPLKPDFPYILSRP